MTKNKSEKKSNKPGKKKSSSKGENKRMKKEAMINAIINVFKSSPKEPFNYRQISSMIGVTNQVQKLQVVDILYDLSSDNFISEIDRGRYRYNDWGTTAVGKNFCGRSAFSNSFSAGETISCLISKSSFIL